MLSFCTSVFDVQINYWAVLVSGLLSMGLGTLWYGPMLFGKQFMDAMGMNQWSPEKQAAMKAKMGITYAGQLVSSLVMVYVFALLLGGLGVTSAVSAMLTGLLVWIGFVVPLKLGDALWGGKWPLFWIGVGYNLVYLLITGAIIGAWR